MKRVFVLALCLLLMAGCAAAPSAESTPSSAAPSQASAEVSVLTPLSSGKYLPKENVLVFEPYDADKNGSAAGPMYCVKRLTQSEEHEFTVSEELGRMSCDGKFYSVPDSVTREDGGSFDSAYFETQVNDRLALLQQVQAATWGEQNFLIEGILLYHDRFYAVIRTQGDRQYIAALSPEIYGEYDNLLMAPEQFVRDAMTKSFLR